MVVFFFRVVGLPCVPQGLCRLFERSLGVSIGLWKVFVVLTRISRGLCAG